MTHLSSRIPLDRERRDVQNFVTQPPTCPSTPNPIYNHARNHSNRNNENGQQCHEMWHDVNEMNELYVRYDSQKAMVVVVVLQTKKSDDKGQLSKMGNIRWD